LNLELLVQTDPVSGSQSTVRDARAPSAEG
jgi:hypothetical protein